METLLWLATGLAFSTLATLLTVKIIARILHKRDVQDEEEK